MPVINITYLGTLDLTFIRVICDTASSPSPPGSYMTLVQVRDEVTNRAILTADSIRSYKYADCRVTPDPDEINGLKGVTV